MINRHNYEEFFLMYVDDELTPQQRADVELFMQQNPDLKSEMELLQQAKLLPDDEILYSGKDALLKSHNSIGIDNYEEYFLYYIDDELNEDKKYEVEKFVLQHPQLQEAFTLLKQTKLEHETVVFADKQSLYRKEQPRVIPIFIKISAVAAVLMGVAVLLWITLPQPGDKPAIANVPVVEKKENNIAQNNDTAKKIEPSVITHDQQNIAVVTDGKSEKGKPVQTSSPKEKDAVAHVPVRDNEITDNITIAAVGDHEKDKPLANADNITLPNTVDNNNDNNNTNLLAENNSREQKDEDIFAYYNPDIAKSGDNYTKPAVYKELNTNEEANDNTIYVGSLGLNKNKVRGIMKKVGGIFSGKSKNTAANENGKLQVAGFELNTN